MATLNETKLAALKTNTGSVGPVNSLEWEWLASQTGDTTLTLEGQWLKMLGDMGYTGTVDEMKIASWKELGYTGSFNELEFQFWSGGGVYSSIVFYAFDESGGAFVADVITGTGSVTEGNTSTRYLPDDSNVYQEFTSGQVGKYYYNDEWWVHCQAAATNSQIYSYDLTNAEWTASNISASLNATGMRGDANGATTLTASANNGTVIANAITAASGIHVTRWFLKRSTGTGTVELTLDNGTTWTDIAASLDSASGWYEAVVDQSALTNPQIGIRLGTSGDAVIVGNAECHLDLYIGAGEVRGGSPIFTTTAAASVNASAMYFDLSNHSNTQGAWYFETVPFFNDDEEGLQDLFVLATDGQDADGAICNIANGSLWSAQYLAAGGSTSQVTRSVVSGTKYKVALAYEDSSDSAEFTLDGVDSGGASAFDGFELGTQLDVWKHLLTAAQQHNGLIRNIRRYDLGYAAAQDIIDDLMTPPASWGGTNLLAFSRDMSNSAWTKTSNTSATYDQTGLDGFQNTASQLNENAAASGRFIRQLFSGTFSAGSEPVVMRLFVYKDNDETRFPEFKVQLAGGTTQVSYLQLNTKTGAITQRTQVGGPHDAAVRDSGMWWEVLIQIDHNGTNTDADYSIFPAWASTFGGVDATVTGSIIVGNAEFIVGYNIADIPAGVSSALYTP